MFYKYDREKCLEELQLFDNQVHDTNRNCYELTKPEFKVIRQYIRYALANNCDIHPDDGSEFTSCDITSRTNVFETPESGLLAVCTIPCEIDGLPKHTTVVEKKKYVFHALKDLGDIALSTEVYLVNERQWEDDLNRWYDYSPPEVKEIKAQYKWLIAKGGPLAETEYQALVNENDTRAEAARAEEAGFEERWKKERQTEFEEGVAAVAKMTEEDFAQEEQKEAYLAAYSELPVPRSYQHEDWR